MLYVRASAASVGALFRPLSRTEEEADVLGKFVRDCVGIRFSNEVIATLALSVMRAF